MAFFNDTNLMSLLWLKTGFEFVRFANLLDLNRINRYSIFIVNLLYNMPLLVKSMLNIGIMVQ